VGRDDPLGLTGATLDERVVIEEVVGEGGFGVVYRARHLGFDETVAVKCLKVPSTLDDQQRDNIIRRFRGEARMLHKLSRKTTGIVQALDVGAWTTPTGAWAPYIVMEWLHGSTLEQDLIHRANNGSRPRSVVSAAELLRPAAEALGIAHGHNVAHLDVKPANLFLALDDDEVILKVLDFGVAKVFTSSKSLTRSMATAHGVRAFTPRYAAPEQFEPRHGRLGPHTDVFALGLILLELTTGTPALTGDTPLQLYMSAINELARPTFAAHGVEVSAAAEEVLRCALAVDTAERFGDAATMWEALSQAVGSERARSAGATSAVVPREVVEAATIAGTGMTTTGHNRLCTIVVGELRGLRALEGKLDAEQLAQLTDRALEAPRRAVEELGGTVYELAAGRVVAIFGLGTDEINAAERAVSAALIARNEVADLRQSHRALVEAGFGLRIGLQTGRVYVNSERQSRITGTPMTLASELQQGADVDGIVIGRDTQRQIAGQFETEPVARDDDDETATRTYLVLGAAKRRHDIRHLARSDFLGIATRFIGREAELAQLDRAIDTVLDTEIPRDLLVVGQRGLGKSRLLLELAGRLRRNDFFVLAAAGTSASQSVSYGLAAGLLRSLFHLHEDEPAAVAENKIRAGLRSLGRGGDRGRRAGRRRMRPLVVDDVVAPLMRVLGMSRSSGEAPPTALSGGDLTRSRIAAAFATVIKLPDQPVAILCDDVQWSDPASLALLDELRLRAEHPLLLACAAQPGVLDSHTSWANAPEREHIELTALSRRHLDRMARDRLQRAEPIPDEVVSKLVQRAEGNALALVEMIHLLVDAGAIDSSGPTWVIDPSRVGSIALPTTVQAIVQARLDRLGNFASDVLCHAAIIGRSFWPGAVAALMGRTQLDLAPTLERTIERQLIVSEASSSFPDERELRFAEASTREVAYEMLSASARRSLHRKAAEWLEERVLSDASSALVAEHYERSGAPLDAIDCFVRAARHATSVSQHEDAIQLYQRARAIDDRIDGSHDDLAIGWDRMEPATPQTWPKRVRLRFELADVLRLDGQLEEARETYETAADLIDAKAEPLDRSAWTARIAYRQAMLGELRGQVEASLERLSQALPQARRAQLPEEEARMLALVAALELRRGDEQASQRACLEGLRLLRTSGRRSALWREAAERLLRTLGGTLYRRGRLFGAERCYRQALRIIDEQAFPHLASRLFNNIAGTRFARGDVKASAEAFSRALEMAERSGEMVVIMATLANLGEVEHALGNIHAAIEYLDDAVAIGDRIGEEGDLADAYRNLAAARASAGQLDAAITAARRALSLARSEAGAIYLPSVMETLTAICTASRDAPAVVALRDEVVAYARSAQSTHPELMTRTLAILVDG
jgi:tetratricopeptide (TPR) repeat protein/class 3 adenylate cyclase